MCKVQMKTTSSKVAPQQIQGSKEKGYEDERMVVLPALYRQILVKLQAEAMLGFQVLRRGIV